MKDLVVVSPHNDDFLIGCFTLLDRIKRVILVEPETKRRLHEFLNACRILDLEREVVPVGELMEHLCNIQNLTILSTSPYDNHYLHRFCAATATALKDKSIGFYSVDMNVPWCKPLTQQQQVEKRKLLDKLFPLEKKLWDKNSKYIIFEGHWTVI